MQTPPAPESVFLVILLHCMPPSMMGQMPLHPFKPSSNVTSSVKPAPTPQMKVPPSWAS